MMGDGSDDPRFDAIQKAPIFRKRSGKKDEKLRADDRFASVLKDDKFQRLDSTIDQYGRKLKKSSKKVVNESGDDVKKYAKPSVSAAIETRLDYLNRLARGEISDEEDDDDDDDDEGDADNDNDHSVFRDVEQAQSRSLISQHYHDYEEAEAETEEVDATSRLAIQNCDWENVKAADLFLVLQSFCPVGGAVRSVTVFYSDFGTEQLALEERYGPQGLWEEPSQEEDDDGAEDEDVVNDIYDRINVNEADEKKREKGEFRRESGAVGLVLHDELVNRGKAKPDNEEAEEEIGDIRLREYELKKLKYYFAIATMDSPATAEAVHGLLDGVEFEHSSMVLDLRFVPEDLSLEGRRVRDECAKLPAKYKPSDFIVNALQHTNVTCTWDLGEQRREKQLVSNAAWKAIDDDDDFEQYLASDDESDSGGDRDGMSAKAVAMRKLLLGDIGDDEDNDDREAETDDFFLEGENDAQNRTVTYIPELGKELLDKKRESQETVFDATMKQLEEKRRQRKARKKALKLQQKGESEEADDKEEAEDRRAASKEDLERLFAGQDDGLEARDYDMREVVKIAKKEAKKRNKNKNKKNWKDANGSEEGFQLDVADERFKDLFEGRADFGIERTNPEFKETPAMKKLLAVQRERREKRIEVDPASGESGVASLASRVKRKFSAMK